MKVFAICLTAPERGFDHRSVQVQAFTRAAYTANKRTTKAFLTEHSCGIIEVLIGRTRDPIYAQRVLKCYEMRISTTNIASLAYQAFSRLPFAPLKEPNMKSLSNESRY